MALLLTILVYNGLQLWRNIFKLANTYNTEKKQRS